jgi:molybdopterin-binding protein
MRQTACVLSHRISEAAAVLGVSDDTLRRWVDSGKVPARTEAGAARIDGPDLATLARQLCDAGPAGVADRGGRAAVSARNRLRGVVTEVRKDTVMAQVELVCGPYRIVSLMSSEAADELGLEPGVIAVASVKSTNVVVELA